MPPGQRVLTCDGYRPVAEVDVRDAVMTGAGRLRLVTKVFLRTSARALVRVGTAGGHVLRATAHHRVLGRRDEGPAQWLAAGDLRVGDLVAVHGGGTAAGVRVRAPLRRAPWPRPPWGDGRDGLRVATLAREETSPYWWTDWTAVGSVDSAPYTGPAYDLEVEEDHSCVTDGIVIADSSCFWA